MIHLYPHSVTPVRRGSRGGPLAAFALALALACGAAAGPVLAQQAAPASQVNINTADAETLADGLNGVGLSRAEEIIRHRETYGPFVSVEELAEVKGIGQATIDRNRPLITLE